MPINAERGLKQILVVGGAGYIGSHMTFRLKEAGYEPIVLDDLSKGHRAAIFDAKFISGDLGDRELLTQIFSTHTIHAVMHFGAFIEVGESVRQPAKYYQNNLAKTLTLLEVMLAHKVKQFIFSSTAAVYGEPRYTPIDEKHPIAPINPYGRSKWMVEEILKDFAQSDQLQYAVLRYFNAAGAHPNGLIGEKHEPESHLIPLVLQTAKGEREAITIYGEDYPTPDGTCIRDYVHILDLAEAHLLALQYLEKNNTSLICNLGTEHGYSVREVIDAASKITGCDITVNKGERRSGDPAVLVANATYAKEVLGWIPQYTELNLIIEHAWRFMQRD